MTLQFYHFSVDDVLDCLLEVSRGPQLFFEHPLFGFLQQLHQDFAAEVDLYLFFQQSGLQGSQSLAQVASSLLPVIQAAGWLRFGPHALDDATPPHSQSLEAQLAFFESAYSQIDRFAGFDNSSHWLRLHYFSECYEAASWLRRRQVKALLTTDKPSVSYRLPPDKSQELRHSGSTHFQGIEFIRSHVRIENLVQSDLDDRKLANELDRLVENADCAVIFTHEYELLRPEVRQMTRRVFDWVRRRQLLPVSTSSHQYQV